MAESDTIQYVLSESYVAELRADELLYLKKQTHQVK